MTTRVRYIAFLAYCFAVALRPASAQVPSPGLVPAAKENPVAMGTWRDSSDRPNRVRLEASAVLDDCFLVAVYRNDMRYYVRVVDLFNQDRPQVPGQPTRLFEVPGYKGFAVGRCEISGSISARNAALAFHSTAGDVLVRYAWLPGDRGDGWVRVGPADQRIAGEELGAATRSLCADESPFDLDGQRELFPKWPQSKGVSRITIATPGRWVVQLRSDRHGVLAFEATDGVSLRVAPRTDLEQCARQLAGRGPGKVAERMRLTQEDGRSWSFAPMDPEECNRLIVELARQSGDRRAVELAERNPAFPKAPQVETEGGGKGDR